MENLKCNMLFRLLDYTGKPLGIFFRDSLIFQK